MTVGHHLIHRLDRLIEGMVALRHDGRFDEPNLDGTRGRLHQLRQLGMAAGRRSLRARPATGEFTGRRAPAAASSRPGTSDGSPQACRQLNVNTTAPMLALVAALGDTPATSAGGEPSGRLGRSRDDASCRARRKAASSTIVSDRHQSTASCGTTRCSWSRCSWPPIGAGSGPARISSTRRCASSCVHARYLADPGPASGSTAGPSRAGTISPAPAGPAAMPGSRPASSI